MAKKQKPIQRKTPLKRKLTFGKAKAKNPRIQLIDYKGIELPSNDIKITPPGPGAFDGKKADYIFIDEAALFMQEQYLGFDGLLAHVEKPGDYRMNAVAEFESESRQQYFGAVIIRSRRYGMTKLQWYMVQSQVLVNVCQECFAHIGAGVNEQIASVAHLLPKEEYPTVMWHMLNSGRLGSHCGCHRNYDNSWESASKMRVWPWAKRIVQTELMPLLTAREFGKLPDLLTADYAGPIPEA